MRDTYDRRSDKDEPNETFLCLRSKQVSAQNPMCKFQGRDKSKGRFYDEYYGRSSSITFSRKGRAKLSGMFETDTLDGEKCGFAGVKTSPLDPKESMSDPGIEER